FPHPKRYLKECIKAYQTDTDIWVNQIYDYIKIAVEQIKKNSDDALNLCDEDQDVFDKYNEFLSKERKKIDDIYILTENKNWDELLCCINKIEFETIPSKIRGLEICERIKSLREDYKEIILKLKKDILICTKEEHQKDIALLCPIIKMLCEIEEEIYDLIEEKKSQQNMLDFPDLEHLAIKLLTNENGEKSDICKQLNSQIKEIMVDECQDINAVQNYIFTLLSNNEDNIFMVGDVKQSIYRFRKAMPELFVKKKKEYPLYSDDKTQNRSTVILDKNFRSRSEVCTFVNKIFEVIMQGEIYYEDPLQCGTSFPENNQAIPEICLLEKECTHSEEEFIALKIEQMIKEGYTVYDWENGEYNARPCRYSDFCILLRSKKDRVLPYQKELEKRNIPNFCDYSQGYFNEYEISVILNFLRVIDNPLLDVPLLSVMMSPIFSFSADDVAKIRKGKKKKSLYSCLLESEYKDLINILEEFRKKATLLSPEELLQEIYDTTDFIELCYALDKGEQKDVNLRLLISYAKKYQQYSNGGLSGFLHYIDTIIEKNEDFLSANVFSKSENSVKIMSIHSSKGLEFPIVIVANCDKKFNAMDEKKFIQFNPNLFIGTAIKDDLHKYDTIPKKAVQLANKTQAVCEEMRCLYVALTRAKEKIIVVASKYNSKKEPESIGLYNILKAGSFIKWILMAISEQLGFYK
ncbi:MAG: 3'-5' exonuclease, partial [Oscillospiraceae bacterium]